jgi:hypothetical protein
MVSLGLKSHSVMQRPEEPNFLKQVRRNFIGSHAVEQSPFIGGDNGVPAISCDVAGIS